jgi:hypothetical protein
MPRQLYRYEAPKTLGKNAGFLLVEQNDDGSAKVTICRTGGTPVELDIPLGDFCDLRDQLEGSREQPVTPKAPG